MKNLLFTILLSLPMLLTAQDTLVAEIRIIKNSNGFLEISYSKDLRYSDESIARYISSVFSPAVLPKESNPKYENKIKKL
jgi:hypothetical protein